MKQSYDLMLSDWVRLGWLIKYTCTYVHCARPRSTDLALLETQWSVHVCPDLQPNVFLSSPPSQLISKEVIIHARFYLETNDPPLIPVSVFLFLIGMIYYFCSIPSPLATFQKRKLITSFNNIHAGVSIKAVDQRSSAAVGTLIAVCLDFINEYKNDINDKKQIKQRRPLTTKTACF